MAVINNSKYIMLLRGNKGKGRGKKKMKKTEGYVVRRLEDEYLVLPSGRRTEEGQRYYVVYLGCSEFTIVWQEQDEYF